MDEQTIRDLTETLNRCTQIDRSMEDVSDRVNYLIKRMNEEKADNIQSGGLYVLKDDDLEGYEVGIKIPICFITNGGER